MNSNRRPLIKISFQAITIIITTIMLLQNLPSIPLQYRFSGVAEAQPGSSVFTVNVTITYGGDTEKMMFADHTDSHGLYVGIA